MTFLRSLILGCVLFSPVLAALENEAARRDHLKRLRGVITAYGLLHDGKPPGRLSDLLGENLLDGPADLIRPGSKAPAFARAEADAPAEYTLDPLPDTMDAVIREKHPLPGEADLLVAFKDGTIKPLPAPAPASDPRAPEDPSSLPSVRPAVEPPASPPPPVVVAPDPTPAVRSPEPPGPAPATLEDAQATYAASRLPEARRLFLALVRDAPNSPDAFLGLGRCANALGEIDEAISAYETLYRLAPQMPHVRTWLAELYLAKKQSAAAYRWVDEELKAQPQSAWAWSWLASVQMDMGNQEDARRSLAQVAALQQGTSGHRYQNGTMLLSQNQPGRAVPEFLVALMLEPQGIGAHYSLGECYLRLGQKERAAASFKAYLQSDATSEWAEKARQQLAALGVR